MPSETFRVPSVGCFECKEKFILKADHLKNYNSSGLCPACWDKAMKESGEVEIGKLKTDIENLKCCGNCGNITMPQCPSYYVGMLSSDYNVWQVCDVWSTDGLIAKLRRK